MICATDAGREGELIFRLVYEQAGCKMPVSYTHLNLIQNISQTVIVPIAGLSITFVLCYELITMVTQKNNFHEFETYNIFLWIFKARCV